MILRLRKLFALLTNPFFENFSGCQRCGIRWYFLIHKPFWQKVFGHEHCTPFRDGHGCFPLCEWCWRDCGSPEARLVWYNLLIEDWCRECNDVRRFSIFSGHGWDAERDKERRERIERIDFEAALIRSAVIAGK